MSNLIIDTASEEIYLKIISSGKEYSIKHNNSRENFDELVSLVFNFIKENNINLSKINNIFVNQGPGKYTSIRSAISLVKAFKISKNVNIYGYFTSQIPNNNYSILLKLLEEGRLTKEFIKPKYLK